MFRGHFCGKKTIVIPYVVELHMDARFKITYNSFGLSQQKTLTVSRAHLMR